MLVLQVSGQPLITTFAPATVNAAVGGTVSLQLKVQNFTNIGSLQFPITYNNAVLQFTSITNATLPGFAPSNYNATAGKVVISWYPDLGLYPNGFSVADNSAIFTVNFNVIANGSTTVNLANTSPGIEVIRGANVIQVNFANGGSNVTGGAGGPGPLVGFHVLANTIHIPKGQTACMPVTVHDFTGIVSMAYAMHWDNAVLQYQNTKSYNIPDLAASNFNLYPAGSNTLLLSWFEQALSGVTKPNGTAIYEVCFKAVGNPGTTSMVTIDGNGFPPGGGTAEVINSSSKDVWKNDSGVSDTIFVVTTPAAPDAVTFKADSIKVSAGAEACVNIRVKNFKDIISTQLGFSYDATKIQFKNFMFGANPLGLSNANFNPNTPGEIKFTWFDPNAAGVDLADSTVIFTICFTAVGPAGSHSPVTFTSLPGFAIEVVKEPGGEVTPNLIHGDVEILAFIQPVCQANATAAACNGTSTGAISATLLQGANPMSYTWSGPGIPPPGSMTTTDSVFNGLIAGTYTVTVTVAGGATCTSTAVVNQPTALGLQSVTPTAVSCFGGQDGAIAVTPSGGTAPFTYKWAGNPNNPNPNNTASVTNLRAGTYTVTVTDKNGCTFVTAPAIQVGQPSDISINSSLVTLSPVTCFGLMNGAVAIPTPNGGNGGFNYAWAGPNGFTAATKNITSIGGGVYTVTITDSKSCSKTFSYTVQAPSAALLVTPDPAFTENATCFGANNGKAKVAISGGTPGYTVSWRRGSPTGPVDATGPVANSLLPGSYYPVATDNNGCTATIGTPITIGGPTEAIAANPTATHVKCNGEANGSITLAPTGGNGQPFTVSWSNGQNTLVINGLSGGSFTPTVTDANGCTSAFAAVVVNEPAKIVLVDSTIVPQDGATPGSISLDVITGGTLPFTFKWSGPNGYTSTVQNPTGLSYGIYTVTITDANNCTLTATAEVKNTNVLVLTTAAPVTASCNDDGCITFNVPPAAVDPVSIVMNGKTYFLDSDTFKICNLASGVYQPTISDGSGNTHTMAAIVIAQLQQALVGDSRTNPFDDFKNGSITLSPIPPSANLTYQWAHGPTVPNLSSLDSGTYVVTITNVTSGCTSVNTYKLVRTYQPFSCGAPQVTKANCLNTNQGAISITVQGGDGPTYTFQWAGPNSYTSASQNITGLFPGVYTLTVIDESGVARQCPVVTVGSQSQLQVTNVNELSNYNGFQVSGVGVCNGKAAVVYAGNSGAVNILWNNGITTPTNDVLCGGAYSVTVTDALGCTSVWVDSLTVPASIIGSYQIASNYNGYAISCSGNCDGRANVSAVGGIPPYTVKWPSGQLDQNVPLGGISQANQLCAGDYQVTITDANNVTATAVITVVEPDPLEIIFEDQPPFSFAACDGEVTATAPVGVGTINYTWSTTAGQTGDGPTATNLCAGTYITFIIEDANGCTAIDKHLVPYPADGCLQVRPIITPGQADGKNDYTLITCIEDYPTNTFEVYNRWGQLVFQTEGYNNGDRRWEGLTASGNLLPDGVYFFVLKYKDDNGKDQVLKGYINLLR